MVTTVPVSCDGGGAAAGAWGGAAISSFSEATTRRKFILRGAISFGTSYHTIEESSESVLGFAGRYDVNAVEALDNIAVFGGAESDGDEQRFRLGTEITRGITTAGLDLIRSNEDEGRTLSQVYIGLAVTPSVSLGLSGLRDTEEATDTTDTRFGLGASVATENGAFFRGPVDGITSDDPAFEVSVGFEF